MWVMLLAIYIVPFVLWQMFKYHHRDKHTSVYPGQDVDVSNGWRMSQGSLTWGIGLIAILGVWKAKWHAIELILFLLFAYLLSVIVQWDAFSKRLFRFWLAGSVVWLAVIASWYLIVSHDSQWEGRHYIWLALLPPFVSALAIGMWKWATARR